MRVVLLISGGGTTATAIIQAVYRGKLPGIKIMGVISSNPRAKGIAKMKALHVPVVIIDPKNITSRSLYGEKLLNVFDKWKVDLISQNGWMPLTPEKVVRAYKNKILNQHPGPLDPGYADFGGKGMFGSRVTCARIAYSWLTKENKPWTCSTTHWVTPEYDKGNVIKTKNLQLMSGDSNVTLQTLTQEPAKLINTTIDIQKKLLPLEHYNVIETIRLINSGKIKITVQTKRLVPQNFYAILDNAKTLAKKLFPQG